MITFYSHDNPRRRLKVHLKDVSSRMIAFIRQAPLNTDKELMSKISRIIGLGHDFGKYTTYFLKHLLKGIESSKANHSFISAVFTYYLLSRSDFIDVDNKYFALLAYNLVLHHHGDLMNLTDDCCFTNNTGFNRKNIFAQQLRDMLKNREIIEDEYKENGLEIDLEKFAADTDGLWQEIAYLADDYDYLAAEEKDYFFAMMNFLYSALIDADKREAAGGNFVPRRSLPTELVDNYKAVEFAGAADNRINRLRDSVYEQVMEKIETVPTDDHIFTFTSPTGSGKTLASFSAALRLRESVNNEKAFLPRIIYSLPFTSIIDQNYEKLVDVLSQLDDFKENQGAYIVKHHHLADISYVYRESKKNAEKNKPLDEALQLIESWESEVVVTTFIQLLYSILGYQNSFLKKYHNIAGSIILLDEVQNIPVEYWELVNKALKLLVKYFNCYVILLTATKPLIFTDDEAVPLLDNHQQYFKNLNRTKIIVDLDEKSLDQLVEDFIELYTEDKSYLIVVNTVLSSLKIYNKINKKLKEKNLLSFNPANDLYYLSANIYPKERRQRVEKIRNRVKAKDNKPGDKVIVVATQVVEAGVDIDMDVIYRDLGPVDSIIQVAGRGNREWSDHCSEVYLYNLREEGKTPFARMVYGSIHYKNSKDLLLGKDEVMEAEYYGLVYKFFQGVNEGFEDVDDSKSLIEAAQELNYSRKENSSFITLADFELIKDNHSYVDVFIGVEEGEKVWDQFINTVYRKKIDSIDDYREKREAFLQIKNKFRSYIISIPLKIARPYINEQDYYNGVFKPNCSLEHYYNTKTGFKRDIDQEEDYNSREL